MAIGAIGILNIPKYLQTTTITLTLLRLFHSVGAISSLLSFPHLPSPRQYLASCKWPLVSNLKLAAGFVTAFHQFLTFCSLFSIGMGGIWGFAASTSLKNLPVEARGLISVLQQGYTVGYLISTCITLTLMEQTGNWRTLLWEQGWLGLCCLSMSL